MLFIQNIYIISWFGDRKNEELIKYRKELHQRQIDWLLKETPENITINILAQFYEDEDFIKNPRIKYIINNDVLLKPNLARNLLKKEFYKTDDDYCLFMDNDIILYDDFFGKLTKYDKHLKNITKNYKIGLIAFNQNNYTGGWTRNICRFFRNSWNFVNSNPELKKEHFEDSFVLYLRETGICEGAYIFRNFKKLDDVEFYYDKKILHGHGADITNTLYYNGFTVYTFFSITHNFREAQQQGKSTFSQLKDGKIQDFYKPYREMIVDKWTKIANVTAKHTTDFFGVNLQIVDKYCDFSKIPHKIVLCDNNIKIQKMDSK